MDARALLCFAVVWGWLLSTILWICMFPDHFFFYAPAAIGYVVGILGYLVLERLAFKKLSPAIGRFAATESSTHDSNPKIASRTAL